MIPLSPMTAKPKIGFYWCASCGGCEEAIVDLAEDILEVTQLIDIVFWPCAMDFKTAEIEAMPDGGIVATFLNGAIGSEEQEEMAHLLRRKSQFLVAYGACAHLGGIPGLADQLRPQHVDAVLLRGRPLDGEPRQSPPPHPIRRPRTRSGFSRPCVTSSGLSIRSFPSITTSPAALRRPRSPRPPSAPVPPATSLPKGTVLAPDTALCDECPRKASKPTDVSFTAFHRPHLTAIDPELCLLARLPCAWDPPPAPAAKPSAPPATCPAPVASAPPPASVTRARNDLLHLRQRRPKTEKEIDNLSSTASPTRSALSTATVSPAASSAARWTW